MDILKIQHISKRFSDTVALDDVSMSVGEHKILGLLGPNGAGKTTLIRIINQITAPDEGEIFFRGEKLSRKHIALIGYLPEERGLYRKMKVGEQAIYLAQLKGVSKKEAERRLKYWFEKFEISSWWNRHVEELSKGMQQKLQFIVTVIHEPPFFIFDEPFSGFDPINANLLKQEILHLKEKGATIIFSTHNMSSVEELCDDIVLINRSQKILEGNIHEIKNRFRKHLFEVEYNTEENKDLSDIQTDLFQVMQTEPVFNHWKSCLQLQPQASANHLLEALLPHVQIISFREMLPDMNEIFISQVNRMGKGGDDA